MTTLLIDGNNAAMRAVHGMRRPGQPRLSFRGVETGPTLAFLNTLSKHIREERPSTVLVAWDGGKSARRVALDPQYKAHRVAAPSDDADSIEDSFSLMKYALKLAQVHQVEVAGFEADDVIAYYWRYHRPLSDKITILSSDKDFLMLLVPDQVEQVRLGSAGTATDRWTYERVVAEMGIEPRYLPDAMALAGDTSDNVPGVPRFGMKTAVKTLAKHAWSLDAAVGLDPRLADHVDRIALNRVLVDLRDGVSGLSLPPLPPFRPTVPGDPAFGDLIAFLAEFGLDGLRDRVYAGRLWST